MKVKVCNDDINEYVEDFEGEKIVIPAQGFIDMQKGMANAFMGRWTPPMKDGTGKPVKPKKLRIEYYPEEFKKHMDQPGFVCMKCGEDFVLEKDLYDHIAENHSNDVLKESKRDSKSKQA